MPLFWFFVLKSYQKARVISLFWPEKVSELGEGYHKIQSLIAIGSGGVLGTDLGGQIKPVNINSASQSELEGLWGIGPVYAQNIIEHRPYSKVEELIEKKILKTNVYDRNKETLTVY